MTIFQMAQFVTLSQSKNYTQAARQLYISQPALSKSISAMEKELNLKLLHRSTKAVSLTAAGEEFARTCQTVLSLYRQGVNNARSAAKDYSGKLQVGLPRERISRAFLRFYRLAQEKYPNIKMDLKFYSENGLLRAIDDKTADFVISFGSARSEDVESLCLFQHRNYAVLPKEHPLSGRSLVSFNDLRHENFLALSYKFSGIEFDRIIIQAGIQKFSPHLIAETGSVAELLTMVSLGRGISVLTDDYMEMAQDQVVFVPLSDLPPAGEYLLWRKNDDVCQRALIRLAEEWTETKERS